MNVRACLVATIATLLLAAPAMSALRIVAKGKVSGPGWSDDLSKLVNDPARVGGQMGLGASNFQYTADSETLNRLVDEYAALVDSQIYLTVATGLQETTATLQVRDRGEVGHSLTISVASEADLAKLVIPRRAVVEFMPAVSESLDPKQKAAEAKLRKAIQARVKAHQTAKAKK